MSEREPPEYPHPNELKKGLHVVIDQGHDKEPIEGEIGVVLGEADPEGARVKLKSGAEGVVRRIKPSEGGGPQPT
ncbi:hypothetical protein LPA44_06580 [Halobacterium sp. KA-4]|uniref:hypothetical protein n=1 Tax=Halobacterium sp. KA-4 TaxID=2896367 RepID=UPI001E4BFBE4|nr:hypothetical protein [Halobacterium sp. KA-4]MCD2199560.1 hypothetical protein [Halobacterium sp. KA-4]